MLVQSLDELAKSLALRRGQGSTVVDTEGLGQRVVVELQMCGGLLEVYFEETELDFWSWGSTTLTRPEQAGAEPDEAFER